MTIIGSASADLDLGSLQLATRQARKSTKELGQEDFLALMIQQLKNQDPLKPMENGEFIGQMAQFSTVTGIADMSRSIGGLTDAFNGGQALQAASMVGRTVLTEGNVGSIGAGQPLAGAVELPYPTSSAVVRVYSSTGELVRELPLGSRQAGLANFSWDGTRSDGTAAPPGNYVVSAAIRTATGDAGLPTYLSSRVESVTLSADSAGTQLRTDSGVTVRLSQVKAVS